MIVCDVETGGLNFQYNPLLSIGAVEYENPSNTFYVEIIPHRGLEINEKAIAVNGIDVENNDGKSSLFAAMSNFRLWINDIQDKTLAGHNPSFDRDFCNYNFFRVGIKDCRFNHRTIDLHSVAYTIFTCNDIPFEKLYSDEIYRLLGMKEEPKPHNALTGAMMEAAAFRELFKGTRFILK